MIFLKYSVNLLKGECYFTSSCIDSFIKLWDFFTDNTVIADKPEKVPVSLQSDNYVEVLCF